MIIRWSSRRADDLQSLGSGAAVVFSCWDDAVPTAAYTAVVDNIEPYVPGEFFRRELPCLLAVISKITEPLDTLVVDGYVRLNDRPALGQHLLDHFGQKVAVIGVAKTCFHGAVAVEVFRGSSKLPLYVTAAGCDPAEAANRVREMHGLHRIPTLLKRVDQLARGIG